MRKRIPWKQYFMMQALVIAQRSTCDRALVGSVLVRENRIIGTVITVLLRDSLIAMM